MVFIILHMFIRGVFLFFMALGFLFNSECDDLNALNHFIMSGVYGSCLIISLGLIIETALDAYTDLIVECNFVLTSAIMNLLVTVLSFYEYYSGILKVDESMHKGFVSCAGFFISIGDLLALILTRR